MAPASSLSSSVSSFSSSSSDRLPNILPANQSMCSSPNRVKHLMCPGCAEIRVEPVLSLKDDDKDDNGGSTPSQAEATSRLKSLSSFLKLSHRRWLCDRCTFCNDPKDEHCKICHSGRTTRNLLTYALADSLYSTKPALKRKACQRVGKRVKNKRKTGGSCSDSASSTPVFAPSESETHDGVDPATLVLLRNRTMLQEAMSLLKEIKITFLDEPNRYHSVLDTLVKYAHGRAATGEVLQTISEALQGHPGVLDRFSGLLHFDLGTTRKGKPRGAVAGALKTKK